MCLYCVVVVFNWKTAVKLHHHCSQWQLLSLDQQFLSHTSRKYLAVTFCFSWAKSLKREAQVKVLYFSLHKILEPSESPWTPLYNSPPCLQLGVTGTGILRTANWAGRKTNSTTLIVMAPDCNLRQRRISHSFNKPSEKIRAGLSYKVSLRFRQRAIQHLVQTAAPGDSLWWMPPYVWQEKVFTSPGDD